MKILFIGYLWPYTFGGHRLIKVARILSQEHEVTVITRPLYRFKSEIKKENFKIVQTKGWTDIYDPLRSFIFNLSSKKNSNLCNPDSGIIRENVNENNPSFKEKIKNFFIKRIFNIVETFFAIPDSDWPWILKAYRKADKLLKEENYDFVISHYPFSSHIVASLLKNKYQKIKWVCDFVDLWSLNHLYPFINFRRKIDEFIEIKTLKRSDKIITTERTFAKKMKKLHKRDISYIPHTTQRFEDSDLLNKNVFKTNNKSLKIMYFGTFYQEMQSENFEIFLEAWSKLIKFYQKEIRLKKLTLKLEFYGTKSLQISSYKSDKLLGPTIELKKRIPYEDALRKMKSSDILLLPLYKKKGKVIEVLSSKFVDYIVHGNHILIVGDHCEELKLILPNYPKIISIDTCYSYLLSAINKSDIFENINIKDKINKEIFDNNILQTKYLSI